MVIDVFCQCACGNICLVILGEDVERQVDEIDVRLWYGICANSKMLGMPHRMSI